MNISVKVEDVLELKRKIEMFNSIKIEDITFTKNGEVLNIPTSVVEACQYINMTNMDFITTGFYSDSLTKEEELYL